MASYDMKLKLSVVEKYPAKQHARRVAKELGVSEGLIYLTGQYDFLTEDSDAAKTWKQRRYFYYCSGVDFPNCCLTYDIKADKLTLYIPSIHPERVVWVGRPPTLEEAQDRYDVDDVDHNSVLIDRIETWQKLHKDAPFFILHKDHKPEGTSLNIVGDKLQPAMDRCRLIKDQHEIICIRRANDISASAHRAVLRNIRNLKNEAQIHGIFEYTCTVHGRAKQAYPPIAGSGKNAGILHYGKNDEPLGGRQLVCLDAGAQYENYASDVTRSFPISGHFSKEAQEIYALVELMQGSCIEMLKPGVRMIDLHNHCHMLLAQGFLALGIFHNGSVQEIVKAGTTKGFLPHGLGHHLGLETHDVINLPILRYTSNDAPQLGLDTMLLPGYSGPGILDEDHQPKLENGMVVTIEPGIYFSSYELNRAYLDKEPHSKYIDKNVLAKYWDVGGVRIEDDILITDNGYENLTTAPKGQEALDIIRNGSDVGPCGDW